MRRTTHDRSKRRSRSSSRGRSRKRTQCHSRDKSSCHSREHSSRSSSRRVRGVDYLLHEALHSILVKLNTIKNNNSTQIPFSSEVNGQNNFASSADTYGSVTYNPTETQVRGTAGVSDVPTRDELNPVCRTNLNVGYHTQEPNLSTNTRDLPINNSDVTGPAMILAEAIRSLHPVRSQHYFVSNVDPSIHDITQWCEEVDRAQTANSWKDHECLSRMASCLKGVG